MCSTRQIMQKVREHLERAGVVSWNAPRTHNHSLEALMLASAACCVWQDQEHARAQTRVSEAQTHMRARGRAMPGIQAGRQPGQMNPSTHRAMTGIQAGRQPVKGDKGRQINPSIHRQARNELVHTEKRASRLGEDKIQTRRQRETNRGRQRGTSGLGDNGRQINPSTQKRCQACQETTESKQRETNESIRARHPGWETTRNK